MTTCTCRWPNGHCQDCPMSLVNPRYWWKRLVSLLPDPPNVEGGARRL